MGWSGVAASLASPTIPIVFSPPAARRRASKKALGDATNKANQVVVLHKEAKKTPTKPVAEPPHEAAHAQHDALWDEWEARMTETPLSPDVDRAIDEAWEWWDTLEAPVCDGVSLGAVQPIRAVFSGFSLLVAYLLIVAAATGFVFLPDKAPVPIVQSAPTVSRLDANLATFLQSFE